ncbi:MAG: hypothetical protein WC901_02995 [Candidatus Margulisiibacteriota bacterium]
MFNFEKNALIALAIFGLISSLLCAPVLSASNDSEIEDEAMVGNPEVYDIRIQDKTLNQIGSILRLTEKDLEEGLIIITGRAQTDLGTIEVVEVTLNEGKTFSTATGTNDWAFAFIPQDGKEYEFAARAYDSTKSVSYFDDMMGVTIQYSKYTPNQQMAVWFKSFREAFNDENTKKCLGLVSRDFEDGYTKLQDRFKKEFADSENLHISFYLDNIKLNQDEDEAIVSFSFKKESNDKTVEGKARAYLRREDVKFGLPWKLVRLEGDKFIAEE